MAILYLLLGWILGILSPVIVGRIQRESKKQELKRSIFVELDDLKHRLACVAYLLNARTGAITKEFLEWIEPIFASYEGPHKNNKILDEIKKFKELGDQAIQFIQVGERPDEGFRLKKYSLLFLCSQIKSLELFKPAFQQTAFDILTQLNSLNEEMENATFYSRKTFDSSLTDENYKIVRANIENGYRDIARMSKVLIDTIDRFTSYKSGNSG